MRSSTGFKSALAAAAAAALAFYWLHAEPWTTHPEGDEPTEPFLVVLVVLDTARSDHLSLCGYHRPTTPTLEALAARGATFTCGAYAPSSWTLPSHASFFTGRFPNEHDAGNGPGSEMLWWGSVNPLGPELPTLAERMRERGYQTVLVSANPLVSEKLGLTRGFEHTAVAERFESLRGAALPQRVRETLEDEASTRSPLFLFVNVIDAHDPWPGVPEGLSWAPARAAMAGPSVNRRFKGAALGSAEGSEVVAHRRDVYDYGVWLADRSLGTILQDLREGGWMRHGFRVVVTSDHGEYLGEHRHLGHGGMNLYEPVVRVPILYFGSDESPPLSDGLSALSAYDLTLSGSLPTHPYPVLSSRWASSTTRTESPGPCRFASAALWNGTTKYACYQGTISEFDLISDPKEEAPQEVPESEAELLVRYSRILDAAWLARREGDGDLSRMLRSLGYLE